MDFILSFTPLFVIDVILNQIIRFIPQKEIMLLGHKLLRKHKIRNQAATVNKKKQKCNKTWDGLATCPVCTPNLHPLTAGVGSSRPPVTLNGTEASTERWMEVQHKKRCS